MIVFILQRNPKDIVFLLLFKKFTSLFMTEACAKMSMTPLEAYENLVIRGVLTNDNETWAEAHALSRDYALSSQQIKTCHANVERWLRLHGVTKMKSSERAALLLMQSTVRRWIVQRLLKQQYDMYSRLAKYDSPDHCRKAMSLQTTLACAWKHIHGR